LTISKSLESDVSTNNSPRQTDWVKWSVVAAASALAGGMAAAWWYRKTLHRLRQAEEGSVNPHFGISEEDDSDDI